MDIKEIELKLKRSETIGDGIISGVFMSYVSSTEVEFLLSRIKDLEAENEILRDGHIEQYDASGYCYMCSSHEHDESCIFYEDN